jgi:hypothetical protein
MAWNMVFAGMPGIRLDMMGYIAGDALSIETGRRHRCGGYDGRAALMTLVAGESRRTGCRVPLLLEQRDDLSAFL